MTVHRGITPDRKDVGAPSIGRAHRDGWVRPLAGSSELLIHLGMTGRLLVSAPEIPLAPHTHAVFTLDDRREIRSRLPILAVSAASPSTSHQHLQLTTYNLQLLLTPAPAANRSPSPPPTPSGSLPSAPHAHQGRAAQSISPARHRQHLRRRVALPRRHPPHTPGRPPHPRRAGPTAHSPHLALRHAIKLGGSSVSDYVDAEGARGLFQLRHRVYRRTGQPCLACATPIRRIQLAGRSTHFCPHCQR